MTYELHVVRAPHFVSSVYLNSSNVEIPSLEWGRRAVEYKTLRGVLHYAVVPCCFADRVNPEARSFTGSTYRDGDLSLRRRDTIGRCCLIQRLITGVNGLSR